ncbi:MAG TPA: hypothetical protein VIK59_12000 [Verrucomicrobiae bacterium]
MELRAHTQRLIDNPSWAFNPLFPRAFSFPDFGTAKWLALTIWSRFAGDASKIPCADKIKAGNPLNWQCVWGDIYAHNSLPSPPAWIPNTTNYSMKHPEGYVQTLLDAQRFWEIEINAWAMEMVEKEYEAPNPDNDKMAVWNCANFSDWPDGVKLCEHFCRRFHAYQQARYRWHEHLLEKHCDRALGKRDKKPQTPLEARACLIGWLSRQRGYARHPLVTSFTRRKARSEKKQERYFFDKDRCAPSKHRYRVTPDEMGWLILVFPIWNFYKWRWTDIGEAVIKKFRFGNRDFMPTSRKRFHNAIRENSDKEDSMPMENWLALFNKYLANPTPEEKEMHEDWEREVHIQRGASAFEELAKLAIGDGLAKQIEPRPSGRGTNQKPPLWDFAQQISA